MTGLRPRRQPAEFQLERKESVQDSETSIPRHRVRLVGMTLMTAGSGGGGPSNLTRNVYHWKSGMKGSAEVNKKMDEGD